MYPFKIQTVILFIFATLLLSGCVSNSTTNWAKNTSGFVSSPSNTQNPAVVQTVPYTVGQGDRLHVRVFGEPTLTGDHTVDGRGAISMPLLRSVQVAGLTTRQVEQQIARQLRRRFLRNPNVSVEIRTFRPFYILGEVRRSGQYPYVDGMSVQTAVAIAGGFTARARRSRVKVTRRDTTGNSRTLSLSRSETLLPGDTIVVEERFF